MAKNARMLNGYRMIYCPECPHCMNSANWMGYVYEHIYVTWKTLGRELKMNEVVHHLDGNRANNKVRNLLVLEKGQHVKLHAWLKGVNITERDIENGENSEKSEGYCTVCCKSLQNRQTKYCSNKCYYKVAKSRIPGKEILQAEISSGMTWCALGRKYGVSNNAVKKWAKKYGILEITPSLVEGAPSKGVETTGEVQSS